MTDPLSAWTDELTAALGVDPALVDTAAVLGLARDVAHGVARPAAPLTAFVVGLAAGRDGATPESIRSAIETARQMATDRD